MKTTIQIILMAIMTNYSVAQSVQNVTFNSDGYLLKGKLYNSANSDTTSKKALVIIAGSWTSIKEQMASNYAQELSSNGINALVFDFKYWGESEGMPRNFENPEEKIKDLHAAVSFAHGLPSIDQTKIYLLGICAGAGYVTSAASQNEKVKGVITVAAWLHDDPTVKMIYNQWPGGFDGLLEKSKKDREQFIQSGISNSVPACSDSDPNAAMYVPNNVFPYYLDPSLGAIPEYQNKFSLMSWKEWLGFDAMKSAQHLKKPLLMIHSETAALPDNTRTYFAQANCIKSIIWENQWNQMDFYYQKDAIKKSVSHMIAWM